MGSVKERVALYARVSTNDQTPENQLRELRRACEIREWKIKREFVDQGISGAKDSRPQLNEMMTMVRRHRFDAVLVWRFDRFARSVRHLITTLDEMNANKVDFISFMEGFDTSSSHGRMMFTVIAAMAEFERSLIQERIMAGLGRAREQGVELGRPNLPEFKIKEILALKGQRSQRDIAAMTGVGKGTVYRVLRNAPLNPMQIVASAPDEMAVGF